MRDTPFTRAIGCELPIQLAGMGSIGTPELARAVSESGGLGMLGGVLTPPGALEEILDSLRRQTAAPFGVNFLMPFVDPEAVQVAAARARVVEFFYGDPDPAFVEIVHRGGALACWQVGSLDEARAAAHAGCDLLVAQGVEAGGHVRGRVPLQALLGQVLAAVDVPVLAAGGIGTGEALAGVLAAGAAAGRLGTVFVAAEESPAHPAYVKALIAAEAEDTVLTEAYSVAWPNAPHRVLASAVRAAEALTSPVAGETSIGGERRPVPRFAVVPPTRDTAGAVDAMALYAGQSVGAVRSVRKAADIVRELAHEARERLSRGA